MKEKWKPIIGWEYRYLISNLGRIKSLPKQYGSYISKPRYLKIQRHRDKKGKPSHNIITLHTGLKNEKGKGITETKRVGRLVAIHFIPNPLNLPEINHKDLDKSNDKFNNLEWCTHQQNIQHSWDMDLNRGSRSKGVESITKKGKILKSFKSIIQAAEYYGIHRVTMGRLIRDGKLLPDKKNTYMRFNNG